MLTRRNFLMASAAAITAPAFPVASPSTMAGEAVGVSEAAAPMPMWIMGTPGEFDWRPVAARTFEDAVEEYKAYFGFEAEDDEEAEEWDFSENICRAPEWDGRDPKSIKSGDWIRIGWGACCRRCDYEMHSDTGYVVGDDAVCEECITLPERAKLNADEAERVVEEVGNDIATDGEEYVRAFLQARGQWDGLPADIWQRALAYAAEGAE